MLNIGFIYGKSEGNVLEQFGKTITSKLNAVGINLFSVDIADKDNLKENLSQLIELEPYFTFSFAGIGSSLGLISNNEDVNFWEFSKIPFISLYGDSPAYREDLHLQESKYLAGLYGFEEHLSLRKTLGKIAGRVGMARPYILENNKPFNLIEKKEGKIIFLKNNFSHLKIRNDWLSSPSKEITSFLIDTSALLESSLVQCSHQSIVEEVDKYIYSPPVQGEENHKLRLLLIRELDRYIRGYKANYLANILLEYPIEIHGSGWDHLDLSNKVGSIFSDVDYLISEEYINKSLAQINISPNTQGGLHDRILRSYGASTLCLSNYADEELAAFQMPSYPNYRLTEDSIRTTIEWALTNKEEVIELGQKISQNICDKFPVEASIQQMLEIAIDIKESEF